MNKTGNTQSQYARILCLEQGELKSIVLRLLRTQNPTIEIRKVGWKRIYSYYLGFKDGLLTTVDIDDIDEIFLSTHILNSIIAYALSEEFDDFINKD